MFSNHRSLPLLARLLESKSATSQPVSFIVHLTTTAVTRPEKTWPEKTAATHGPRRIHKLRLLDWKVATLSLRKVLNSPHV